MHPGVAGASRAAGAGPGAPRQAKFIDLHQRGAGTPRAPWPPNTPVLRGHAMSVFDIRHTLPLLLALACFPALAQHDRAGAHHDHAAPAPAQPAHGQRWATDANLRAGMGRIRAAVDELRHHEMGHMGDERAVALAEGIGGDVGWIVGHCELAPEADAALHPIVGKLAANASALKSNPADPAPIASMREALADYARLFDDPGAAVPASDAAAD
jgi:hypothetical protein